MAAARIQHWAAGLAGWGLITAFRQTWRITLDDPRGVCAGVRDGSRPVVSTFWHRHIIPMCAVFGGSRVCVPVSESSDGEYIAQTMLRFGLRPVRGSSSRGAVKALRELVGLARQGWSPALTPDGPRGPRYSVQPGFVLVARRCGLPVYPVGVAAEPAWEANSWDGTVVPYPGARVVIHVGEPLEPDDHPDRDEFCRVIGDAMQDACARAEDML